MTRMSTDASAPTTDWTRYGERIDMANPTDSRAIVVGLTGSEARDILELGCSAGMMTQLMSERGHSVTAVEIDPVAAALAAPFSHRLLIGDLESVDSAGAHLLDDLDDGSFDIVIAADVLEHLRDPTACLRRSAELLRPDGMALLSIPNVAHADIRLALLEGHFDYRDNGLLDRTHTHLFTLESAAEMIRAAGLVPVAWDRTVRPMGDSEIPIDENLLELGRRILAADPEATTYQWIVTCRRADSSDVVAVWPQIPTRSPVVEGVLELMNAPIPHPIVVPQTALQRIASGRETSGPLAVGRTLLGSVARRLRTAVADVRQRAGGPADR